MSKETQDPKVFITQVGFRNPEDSIPEYAPLWSFRSTRLYIALILMFVVLCALNMRINIGMAMVCMVNSTAYSTKSFVNYSSLDSNEKNSTCGKVRRPSDVKDLGYHGTFLWNPQMQSALISSTAYGSFFTILLSGYISDLYGPRLVCMCALILYTTGAVFPAVASLISRWFPANERSTVAAIYTSGSQLGNSMGTFLASRLCLLTFMGGWPLIFYMYGVLGIICTILWCLFATNKPEECKFIGEKEKNYLQYYSIANNKATPEKKNRLNAPWLKIVSSLPVWACVFVRFSFAWNGIVMSMLLPSYFRDVLFLDMGSNGLFTSLPLLVQLFSKNILAFMSDSLKKSGKMGITASTKMIQTFASFGSCLAIFGLIFFVDCTRPYLALFFLVLYGLFVGGTISGAFTASLCIAPEFSGIIESITGFANVFAYIASAMTAGLINKTGSSSEWALIFIINVSLILFSGLFFLVFGSADVQPWSKFSNENTVPSKVYSSTGEQEAPKDKENQNHV